LHVHSNFVALILPDLIFFVVFVAADKKIYIFNSENGQCLATLDEGHNHGVNDIIWIDDRIIASGSDDYTLNFWDIETVNLFSRD